jgi:hypothetical protein
VLSAKNAPSPAAQSPFHAKEAMTVESQIASVLTDKGPWAEERIDDDHIRMRRGTTCVIFERPRSAIIDPFSDAAQRIPWAGQKTKC